MEHNTKFISIFEFGTVKFEGFLESNRIEYLRFDGIRVNRSIFRLCICVSVSENLWKSITQSDIPLCFTPCKWLPNRNAKGAIFPRNDGRKSSAFIRNNTHIYVHEWKPIEYINNGNVQDHRSSIDGEKGSRRRKNRKEIAIQILWNNISCFLWWTTMGNYDGHKRKRKTTITHLLMFTNFRRKTENQSWFWFLYILFCCFHSVCKPLLLLFLFLLVCSSFFSFFLLFFLIRRRVKEAHHQ